MADNLAGTRVTRRGSILMGGAILRGVSLVAFLVGTWLLLSGRYEPLILAFGVVSIVIVALIAYRMGVVDYESHPINLGWRLPAFWIWLLWEIVKANIDVAKRIIHPRMPISPTVFTLEPTQPTELGLVIYANSITLTPGTVTLQVERGGLEVHALSRQAAEDLAKGEMDRRVTWIEGAS
ncbi:MAG: Na+/H+ antiporter subunit E [Alphaproteobacteria bacterium]